MTTPLVRPTRTDVLADTEETLRAVAKALGHVTPDDAEPVRETPGSPIGSLARFLALAYEELAQIMEGVRESRGIFRRAEVERLKGTHVALQEVTFQTELATTDMLDGLERSLALLERIGTGEVAAEEDPSAALREELHQVIQHLQFQDITSQRIGHAMRVLADVEQRFLALMRTLDACGFAPACSESAAEDSPDPGPEAYPDTCDPLATTQDGETRQALADELFG